MKLLFLQPTPKRTRHKAQQLPDKRVQDVRQLLTENLAYPWQLEERQLSALRCVWQYDLPDL
jgi:hypothetical protein